jgi:hypothetical protein
MVPLSLHTLAEEPCKILAEVAGPVAGMFGSKGRRSRSFKRISDTQEDAWAGLFRRMLAVNLKASLRNFSKNSNTEKDAVKLVLFSYPEIVGLFLSCISSEPHVPGTVGLPGLRRAGFNI